MSIPLRTRTLPEARSFAPPTAARTRESAYLKSAPTGRLTKLEQRSTATSSSRSNVTVCGATTSSFTLTRCPGLGSFLEIEVIDKDGTPPDAQVPGRRSHARRPSTPTRHITVPLPDTATYRLARRR